MKTIKDIINEKYLIDKETGVKVLTWMKAKWSVSIVDPSNTRTPIKTILFKNFDDMSKFFKKEEPEYFDHCEGGPSITDMIYDMDGSEKGGSCIQFCYDQEQQPWKYYIVSKISSW